MRLIPLDDSFQTEIEELAAVMVDATVELRRLFENARPMEPDWPRSHVAAIKALEHAADARLHRFTARLFETFRPHLDAEDLLLLANNIDNVIDRANAVAWRMEQFRVEEVPLPAVGLASLLARSARAAADAVAAIRKPKTAWTHTAEVKRLEEEGDRIFHGATAALFDPDTPSLPPLEIIKWKELYELLENAVDECKACARVVEMLALK